MYSFEETYFLDHSSALRTRHWLEAQTSRYFEYFRAFNNRREWNRDVISRPAQAHEKL